MNANATTNKSTQIISVRNPPVNVRKGTRIEVFDEANGWGLVDAIIAGKEVSGEMRSADYDKD